MGSDVEDADAALAVAGSEPEVAGGGFDGEDVGVAEGDGGPAYGGDEGGERVGVGGGRGHGDHGDELH